MIPSSAPSPTPFVVHVGGAMPPAPVSPLRPSERLMHIGGPHIMVNGRHGGFLANSNDSYVGMSLIRYGEYCELEWHLLSQIIRPGMIVAEVGANIGAHTVPIAKAVGLAGRVIAVEPQRIIHQYLCANVAFNGLPHVETYHCGCGAERGMMSVPVLDYYGTPNQNFGATALVQHQTGEPVEIRMLDDILGTRPVSIIKVDAEGMEADVLRGSRRIIERWRPFLYVENVIAAKSEELIRLIQGYRYRLFWHITNYYNPNNYFSEREDIYPGIGSYDMLCLPEESSVQMNTFTEITDPTYHPLRESQSR